MTALPKFEDVQQAHERIKPYIHQTPVMRSELLDAHCGVQLFCKCENLQKIGAFKIRGALNAALQLPKEKLESGVATHSSGNHAAALAKASQVVDCTARIVMPSNAPAPKKAAVRAYGGIITECEPTLTARETTLEQIIADTGATLVHPYNNSHVIAGQGTLGLELHAQTEHLDVVITPVGGGGMLSGTSLAMKTLSPNTRIIGAEPTGADDAQRSLRAGRIIPMENPNTIADGLLTSLGEINFALIKQHVDDILTVTDTQIVEAMHWVWSRMKIIIEPSAATSLAVVMAYPEQFAGQRVGVVFSGGNLDFGRVAQLFADIS
ncbi:MAG: pyridoxal-phosphate dependent enzyme [Pseudomonadota bacterium]